MTRTDASPTEVRDEEPVIERPVDGPESAGEGHGDVSPTDDGARAPRWRRIIRAAAAHPVLTTAALGLLFVLFQMWWIVRARHLGSFDVDEAGGLAAALRFHRSFGIDPRPLWQVVFDTRNGPLVPLLSVPFQVLGPGTFASAMVVQPVLVVLAACGAAGTVRAMGHRRAAVVAGIAVLGLPVSIVSSRSFQYSTGVGAFLALAMWALAASDRGRDRTRMVLFGAAVGAMLLSRTMAAGFVPGVAVAALVVVVRERRAWRNLGLAALSTVVVAGPWWLAQWRSIWDYLFVNAYGDRAHYWGSVALEDRWRDHVHFVSQDFRVLRLLMWAAVAALVLAAARWLVSRGRAAFWSGPSRILLASWIVVGLGTAALLSTSNRGFWFAYPLDVVMVAGLVGVVAHVAGGRRWTRAVRVAVASATVAVVVVNLAVSASLTGAANSLSGRPSTSDLFIDSLDRLQLGSMRADHRLATADPELRRIASEEWYDATIELSEEIQRIQDAHGTLWQSVTGEIHLFNANTIALAQEASRIGINGIHVVNTLEPPDDVLREDLTPFRLGIPRVLVIIDGRSLEFPDGRGHDRFRRLADEEGWRASRTIPLPDGGEVVVHTHPDSVPEG